MGLFNQVNPGERARQLRRARAVTDLEDTDGWKVFVELSHNLMAANTPEISSFTQEEAAKYASQLVFISGIKRCLGLMDQQKGILKSLKDK